MKYISGTYHCGCKVLYDYSIVYCNKHNSAPDLYEACETFQSALAIWQQDPSKATNTITTIFLETIGKALAKAKGKY